MSRISSLGLLARSLGLTALVLVASACYAGADVEPVYVDATVAPVDVEAAPQYYYEGRTVYYVNDHWYAHDGDRWVYYRTEPEPLVRHRVEMQGAPAAPQRAPVVERRPREEAAPAEQHRENQLATEQHRENQPPAEQHRESQPPAEQHREKRPPPAAHQRRANPPPAEHGK